MRLFSRICTWVLVAVSCAAPESSPRQVPKPETERQYVWAEWRSLEVRAAWRAELEAADLSQATTLKEQLLAEKGGEFLRRNRVKPAELVAIRREGEKKSWHDLPICQIPSDVIYMNALVLAPESLTPIVPQYTKEACSEQVEGVAILQLIMEGDHVREAKVLKGLPHGLNGEAVRAAEHAQWSPGLICGKPATVAYTVAVEFRLPPSCIS